MGEGTVSFEDLDNGSQIGSQLTPGTVGSGGMASATYVLPGGTVVGTYTIVATYIAGPDYNPLGSSDNTHALTVNQASTSIIVTPVNTTAVFDSSDQDLTPNDVTLNAVVTATNGMGTVNEGTVTFSVFDNGSQIGSAVTSGTVSNGDASAIYVLPGGTPVGTYIIVATYNPAPINPDYLTSTSNKKQTLTVDPAPTATVAASQMAFFGSADQDVTLSATVTATVGSGLVDEGTVSFEILDNGTQIGTQLTAGTVSGGMATTTYVLPGGTAALGTYTIIATYNPGPDYTGSDNSLQPPPPFTVNKASTSITVSASARFTAAPTRM